MKVVLATLATIPRLYAKVSIPTTEITALELERLEHIRWEVTKAAGGLPIRRVSPGLHDMVDPTNIEHRGITSKDGKLYHWWYWSKHPEDTGVTIEMEKNLVTGALVPWTD